MEEDLVITRGLLEKRTTTIPIRKIQAVKITESPFRQPFGYASVAVEYAGSSMEEEKADGLLMPVVKKKRLPLRFKRRFLTTYLTLILHVCLRGRSVAFT
ncbi:PH domain-containing protein [Bacillus sp. N9]